MAYLHAQKLLKSPVESSSELFQGSKGGRSLRDESRLTTDGGPGCLVSGSQGAHTDIPTGGQWLSVTRRRGSWSQVVTAVTTGKGGLERCPTITVCHHHYAHASWKKKHARQTQSFSVNFTSLMVFNQNKRPDNQASQTPEPRSLLHHYISHC